MLEQWDSFYFRTSGNPEILKSLGMKLWGSEMHLPFSVCAHHTWVCLLRDAREIYSKDDMKGLKNSFLRVETTSCFYWLIFILIKKYTHSAPSKALLLCLVIKMTSFSFSYFSSLPRYIEVAVCVWWISNQTGGNLWELQLFHMEHFLKIIWRDWWFLFHHYSFRDSAGRSPDLVLSISAV